MQLDLSKHEHTLRMLINDEPVIMYALARLRYGEIKYATDLRTDRDYIDEAFEEFVDGLNRLIMEVVRSDNTITPLMQETITTAYAVIRALSLLASK